MQSNSDSEIAQAIRTLIAALARHAQTDAALRDALGTLARWAQTELDAPNTSAPARTPVERAPPQPLHPEPAHSRRPTVVAPPPMVETTLRVGDLLVEGLRVPGTPEQARAASLAAGRAPEARDALPNGRQAPAPDPDIIAKRSRLKADACRWAIERRARVAAGADFLTQLKPTDASLIEAARALPDCYLWMLDPRGALPDDASLEALAGSFDALALAADVARRVVADAGAGAARNNGSAQALRRDLYWLVAEAQSAVRAGVLRAGQRIDRDQMDLFVWLRERTSAERIFVERHMKVEDPADPARWRDLAERLSGFERAWEASRHEDRLLRDLRHKASYHAHRLRDAGHAGDPADRHALFGAIDGLLARGVAPSAREIADLLVPLLPSLASSADSEASPGARLAIAAAERLAASGALEDDEHEDESLPRERSPETLEAAELLRGRTVIFIGGERRRDAQERLERDLELGELRWSTTAPHQSLSVFEPEIARPEVSVVLLAIRWASHSYGELQDVCNRYGKIFVRLPGGYSSNQVAMQVLTQAAERLRAQSAPTK